MPRVQLKNAELYYEIHGSGPLFVFVHGLTGNHVSWFHQLPEFAKRYKCLVYDQRCFGLSQFQLPESGASFVDDLYELIGTLGDRDVRLMGQSWGGNVALQFAVKHPEMVKALVLAGSEAGLVDRETASRIFTLPPDDPRDPLAINYAANFNTTNPASFFLFGSILRTNPARPQDFMSRARAQAPTAEALSKITFPTLFIVGEEDKRTTPVLVKAGKDRMPNSKMVVVPNSGHSTFLENPQSFNHEVLSFLASAERTGAAV